MAYTSNFDLSPGEGYFIKTYNESILRLYGDKITKPAQLSLETGWNFVGTNFGTGNTAKSFLELAKDTGILLDSVTRWEKGAFKHFISEEGKFFGSDFDLEETSGYFIKVDGEGGTISLQ